MSNIRTLICDIYILCQSFDFQIKQKMARLVIWNGIVNSFEYLISMIGWVKKTIYIYEIIIH